MGNVHNYFNMCTGAAFPAKDGKGAFGCLTF